MLQRPAATRAAIGSTDRSRTRSIAETRTLDLFHQLWEALGRAIDWALARGGWELTAAGHFAARTALLVFLVLAVLILIETLASPWRELWSRFRYYGIRDRAVRAELRGLRRDGDLEGIARLLLRHRSHRHAARVLEKAGQPELAAEAWEAAGETRRAVAAWQRAGRPLEAADALQRTGDDVRAAELFLEGDSPARAAAAFRRAGRPQQALTAGVQALARPEGEVPRRNSIATDCLEILDSGPELPAEEVSRALPVVAAALETSERWLDAARLWERARDWERVGHCRQAAGDEAGARTAWENAGRPDLVARLDARAHEEAGDHRAAAAAWSRAGEPARLAAAWDRAGEPAEAAAAWEEAGEPYRAGRAWADAADFERAARALQRVPEDDPDFDASRLLLGRCFHLLDDWGGAAAVLEDHLRDVRVTRSNAEHFYTLALANERLGKLRRALEILRKVRAVDLEYRDVRSRIDSLQSSLDSGPEETAGEGEPETRSASAGRHATEERYRLEEEIGRGGMGVVFRAWDTVLERTVALKKLALPREMERFRREARAAAGLQHPHLVTVYDYWETGTDAFLAMELVEGPTLARELYRIGGPLETARAVRYTTELCRALGALHVRKILHRDVKPENIFLSPDDDCVKLGDFGLARRFHDGRITRPGSTMGTPFYLAPELLLGEPGDERSDLYSLGLVLHECLTGDAFYSGAEDPLASKLREDPPPPSHLGARVGPALDAVVERALARDPDDRFQRAEDLEAALQAAAE